MTEVWFRDPFNYVRELVECEIGLVAWNRGVVHKRRIDPIGWADLYFGGAIPVRQILIGPQGSAEIGPGNPLEKPLAVYPTWSCADNIAFLEEMMASNVGDDMEACLDLSLPPDERPVYGQEHRVVVTEIPRVNTGPGRAVMRKLKEMQEEYPDCKLHMHGLYSFKFAFGMGFAAADMEPRTAAANGKLMMAVGNEVPYEKAQQNPQWVTVMGMKPAELQIPRNRCIFNIKSAVYAGDNFVSFRNPRTTVTKKVDYTTPAALYTPPNARALPLKAVAKYGDKTLCDMCSLANDCKQFRSGEVCSLTDGNTGELARFFNTRDSHTIIDGLGVLLQMGANRLENAAREEVILGDTDDKVTKMINNLFAQGVTLAKLVDPALRSSAVKVNVGVINGQASVTTGADNTTPHELVGEVMRSLERQGIPRDKITPELVMATIQGMADPESRARAIEGAVIAENG